MSAKHRPKFILEVQLAVVFFLPGNVELNYALSLKKGICGIRFPRSYGRTPGLLKEIGAPIAKWNHDEIIAAIECAAASRS